MGNSQDIEGPPHAGNRSAPGRGGGVEFHGFTLPQIGAAQRQGIETVEQVFDAKVEPDLGPGITAPQIEEGVARGFDLVTDLGQVILGIDHDHLDAIIPTAQLLGQR